MKIKALKTFSSIQAGNFEAGKTTDCPDWLAKQYEAAGMVEIIGQRKTKVIPNDFTAGQSENGLSSPAAQVSKKKIAKKPKNGATKTEKGAE